MRRLMAGDAVFGRAPSLRFTAVLADRLQAARVRLAELYAYPADPAGLS